MAEKGCPLNQKSRCDAGHACHSSLTGFTKAVHSIRSTADVRRAHPGYSEGPRTPSARGVADGHGALGFRCRRQGSAGTEGRRWGGGSAAGFRGGARWCGARDGRTHGSAQSLTGRGASFVKHRPGYASPGATVSTGCGRSRASPGPTTPSDVTGLLSPADRPRHGARSHDAGRGWRPASHRSGFPPVGRRLRVVVQAAPGWRGTGNNEASQRPVTRRMGESATELRSGSCAGARAFLHAPARPRNRPHTSQNRPRC